MAMLIFALSQVWNVSTRKGSFELELIKQLHHTDSTRRDGANMSAGITCILPQTQVVYTGDESGRVVSACRLSVLAAISSSRR